LVISNNPAKYSDLPDCVIQNKFDNSDLGNLRTSVRRGERLWPAKFNAVIFDDCTPTLLQENALSYLLATYRTCNHQVFILMKSLPERRSDIRLIRQVDSTLIVFPQADTEMPIHRGKDSKGCYYQYGSQAKYYYTPGNAQSRAAAKQKALVQARAIQSSQHRVLYLKWA